MAERINRAESSSAKWQTPSYVRYDLMFSAAVSFAIVLRYAMGWGFGLAGAVICPCSFVWLFIQLLNSGMDGISSNNPWVIIDRIILGMNQWSL